MPDVNERLDSVEQGLTRLGERMDAQFTKVDERFAQVDQRFGTLETEVRKLRVLEEANASSIKQIAEVQVHHGQQLQQLIDAVEPLKGLRDFVERVAHDHEHRITALEEASRQHTPET